MCNVTSDQKSCHFIACTSLFRVAFTLICFLWPIMMYLYASGVETLDHMLLEILISFAWLRLRASSTMVASLAT
jgi:hypothetical protein